MNWHAVALLVLIPAGSASSQDQEDQVSFSDPFEDILSFCAPLIFPKMFQDVHRLREYIRSDEYREIRAREGDLLALDRLFEEALQITWKNPYEALLISFVATMDHRRFGTRFPVVGSLFWFPLTSEFPDEFADRVQSLPSRIYPDSPDDRAGDRDKLQHFFGSAFLAHTFESVDAADRVGYAVELGEETFVVSGRFDDRDLRANRQGQMFGAAFLLNNQVRPSDFLLLVTAAEAKAWGKTDVPDHMGEEGLYPCGSDVPGGTTVMEENR